MQITAGMKVRSKHCARPCKHLAPAQVGSRGRRAVPPRHLANQCTQQQMRGTCLQSWSGLTDSRSKGCRPCEILKFYQNTGKAHVEILPNVVKCLVLRQAGSLQSTMLFSLQCAQMYTLSLSLYVEPEPVHEHFNSLCLHQLLV